MLMSAGQSFEQTVVAAREMLDGKQEIELVIRFLRDSGLSQIECVKAVKAIRRTSLADAKGIVHFSETWSDMRLGQEQLHEQLANEIEGES
jgi:ribosomal protein L7/L12